MVFRRLGTGQRQSILDFRLHAPRRPAIFLRGAGVSGDQLSARHQSDAAARWSRSATTIFPPRSWAST
jgi:hypothetical protein